MPTDHQAASEARFEKRSPPRPLLALPIVLGRDGSEENELNAFNTIAIIAILMAVIIAAAGAAVSLLFALNRLVGE